MTRDRIPIPARTGWGRRLKAGWSFRVVDVEGGQAADLWVFNADDSEGCLSELLRAEPGHASREENLKAEARKHGFQDSHVPRPINVLANFRVGPDGRLAIEDCLTQPGDAATFDVLMDNVVGLSACPQGIVQFQISGPTDMGVELQGA